jgi:hypothetical protein
VIVNGGTPAAWRNAGKSTATCLWVELVKPLRR